MIQKKNLLISFSGGRTSAYMLYFLCFEWEERHNYNIIVVFANTGKENPGTLRFVLRCEQEWNIPINWVEGVYKDEHGQPLSKKGWKVSHKVVDYFTASRGQKLLNGKFAPTPFEEMVSLLGIPSTNSPFCSYQLKKNVIESFLFNIGFEDYQVAIGIRIDEVDRVSETYKEQNIIYPLISIKPKRKRDITIWWKKQSFDLEIDPDLGNCEGCWKKDMKRLIRISKNTPEVFEWWQYMTDEYGYLMPRKMKKLKPPFNFYRGNLSPADIFKLGKKIKGKQLDAFIEKERLNSCSESCEAFQ